MKVKFDWNIFPEILKEGSKGQCTGLNNNAGLMAQRHFLSLPGLWVLKNGGLVGQLSFFCKDSVLSEKKTGKILANSD